MHGCRVFFNTPRPRFLCLSPLEKKSPGILNPFPASVYKIGMEKEKRIEELMATPRMFYVGLNYSACNFKVNSLAGLMLLIEDCTNEDTVAVEVGSFSGVSSELFALHCKRLHCIDLWDPYWEISEKRIVEFAEWSFDRMAAEHGNIEKIKGDSVEAADRFPDRSLDLVYIDAAHDYDSVKRDLLAWIPKVKEGGWIAGHDYRHDESIQVYEAVNEIFAETHRIVTYPDSSFAVRL